MFKNLATIVEVFGDRVLSLVETDVQPSYDGRRWSWVVADIFWSPGSYIGRRLAA